MRYSYRRPAFSSGFGMMPPTPRSIKKLLWANFLVWFVFAAGIAAGLGPAAYLFRWLSLTPHTFLRGALWQPASYMFLHDPGGLWHVGLNLFALWMFGGTLARDWGDRRFLTFYFTSGIGAALADVALRTLTGSGAVATVGASGAVLAVVTAFAVTYPRTPILISFILPVPAWVVAVAYAAINLLGAVQDLARGGNPSGTAFTVHLAGMALGYYLVRRRGGIPEMGGLLKDLQARHRQWQLRQARKKFEVYMRDRDRRNGPWTQ